MIATILFAAAAATVMEEPLSVTRCDPVLSAAQPYYPYTPWYPGAFYGAWYGPWYGPWYGAWTYPVPLPPTATLTVHYVNRTDKPMRTIDFGLMANGFLVARVRDVGTFSPGIEIKHELPLDTNVFPLQTGLPVCLPLEIGFVDGTTWSNPGLDVMRRQLYEPVEPRGPRVSPTP
ncbi:MAG TPA: hypothetical protein VFN49_10400 [Candidatus Aquilonibacter sp.]|nr:hypothetical protein [Candidatus Aquilonibacter sp.]